MSIKINYIKKNNTNVHKDIALFVNETFEISHLKKFLNKSEITFLENIIKKKNTSKKIISLDLNANKSLIIIKILKNETDENLGAEFYNFIKENNFKQISIFVDSVENNKLNFINNFLHGFKLKSYEFGLYKSNKTDRTILLNVLSNKNLKGTQLKYLAIEDGTNFARDLVSEPPNVLYPKEYANRLLKLKKLGVRPPPHPAP